LYNTSVTTPAFQAAHHQDLFFFATRNNAPAGKSYSTNNKVVAINSDDGSVAWTYAPNDLDIVNGGMMVDYQRNTLWVASRSGNNTLASLRVLSSLDGSELGRLSLGDIDNGVVRDYGNPSTTAGGQAYVVNNVGVAYGLDLTTLKVVWSANVGAMSAYPFPTGNGFIASLKKGQVAIYTVNGTTVSRAWSTPIANPSGVRVDYVAQKIFVGSSDKSLHQLDVATGADERQVAFNSQVGTPTIDTTPSVYRLHVGLADGRLCALQLPLP
jgi:outer membrane protein assembly factor BamB